MTPLTFFVSGIPAPGGSKRFVGFGKNTGRAILIDAAGERNKNWRAVVALAGKQAMEQRPLWQGVPLRVKMDFVMNRPQGHFNSKGALKPSAPFYHTKKPDALKLSRSTEDALTGIAWVDDASTAMLEVSKVYAGPGESTGCKITIQPIL